MGKWEAASWKMQRELRRTWARPPASSTMLVSVFRCTQAEPRGKNPEGQTNSEVDLRSVEPQEVGGHEVGGLEGWSVGTWIRTEETGSEATGTVLVTIVGDIGTERNSARSCISRRAK